MPRHNEPRDELELRRWLARAVGSPDVPEPLWQELKDDRYVKEALELGENGREGLVDRARRMLKFYRKMAGRRSRPGRAGAVSESPTLGQYEQEWAHALSLYIAKGVAALPRVRRFREEVLGGTMRPQQALEVIQSPILARHSRNALPTVLPLRVAAGQGNNEATLTSERVGDALVPLGERDKLQPRRLLRYPGKDGWQAHVPVDPGSILDELRELAERLAKRYPWQEAQAVGFLLTGAVPLISPIRIGTTLRSDASTAYTGAEITLRVDPRVPAEAVERTYRRYQRGMLGGDNRRLSRRNVALFRFVTERTDGQGRRPAWPEIMGEWNRTQPAAWRYRQSRRLARDYGRARDWLVLRKWELDPDL